MTVKHKPGYILFYTCGALLFAALLGPAAVETLRGRDRQAWRQLGPPLPVMEAARMAAEGRRVIFVDVREPQEYAEFHIPGAVAIPLRDLHRVDLERFSGAEAVFAYCLKDFRGWEGTRILIDRGVRNVRSLENYGITQWRSRGLPMAGSHTGKTDAQAMAELRRMFHVEEAR